MKKKFMRSCSMLCATLTLASGFVSLAGCGVVSGPQTEAADPARTQLYVFNYNSGFGSEWIDNIKKEYEELNKDTIYEPGVTVNGQQKKGIQIIVKSQKEKMGQGNNIVPIKNNREEIYFTEFSYYNDLMKAGVIGDITPAITGDLSKRYAGYDADGNLLGDENGLVDYASTARETEGSTILSKMTETQVNYFNKGGSYYAMPHYAGYYGLTYNVDVFDERGYYFCASANTDEYDFADTSTLVSDYFIEKDSEIPSLREKSVGPDGKTGVIGGVDYSEDDGLPATYKEFFMLCKYMLDRKDIPITWNGNASNSYLNYLLQSMVVDHDGLDNTMVTYDLSGTIDNLGNIVNGEWVEDAQDTTLTYGGGNGWNVSRSAGRYYGLQFMSALINGKYGKKDDNGNFAGYYKDGIFSSTNSHIGTQKDYLESNIKSEGKIGMLVDGIWWENEANEAFDYLKTQSNGEWTKDKCNFKFMPLPHATKAEIGQKRTVVDTLFSLCFMKSTIADWKKPIAYDFIKFVNSHDQLVKFTQTTNAIKSLEYSLTDGEKETLTTFGKSVVNMREKADVVYPFATNAHYQSDASGMFFTHTLFKYSEGQKYVGDEMYRNKTSADSYFVSMINYYKNVDTWKGV